MYNGETEIKMGIKVRKDFTQKKARTREETGN
jgi:hypothetical protein